MRKVEKLAAAAARARRSRARRKAWLDDKRPVRLMTWAPGPPMFVHNRFVADGGWIEKPGGT